MGLVAATVSPRRSILGRATLGLSTDEYTIPRRMVRRNILLQLGIVVKTTLPTTV
jgi:hypothetical protein